VTWGELLVRAFIATATLYGGWKLIAWLAHPMPGQRGQYAHFVKHRVEPIRFDVPPLRVKTETMVRCLHGHDALQSESELTPQNGWICNVCLENERALSYMPREIA
jgi:hypothetical protein